MVVLQVSKRAIKSRFCSLEVSDKNLNLAKSQRPLLFQKISFIYHLWGFLSTSSLFFHFWDNFDLDLLDLDIFAESIGQISAW